MKDHYTLISKAINFLIEHRRQQVNLETLSEHLQLSPSHCQRLFQQWAGLSPKQFSQFLSKQTALEKLKQGQSLLETSMDCGLSGPSRLHDLILHWEAMTPGQYKRHGQGLTISYGFYPSPLGEVLIASTNKGICHLSFTMGKPAQCQQELFERWPQAQINLQPEYCDGFVKQLFRTSPELPLHIIGTPFQHKVWEALLRLPAQHLCSYQELAKLSDNKSAIRAVASAVAKNPIAVIIPCHRIIRQSGEFGNYHWGQERKIALLMKEGQEREPNTSLS